MQNEEVAKLCKRTPRTYEAAVELHEELMAVGSEYPSGSPEDLACLTRRAEIRELAEQRGWVL